MKQFEKSIDINGQTLTLQFGRFAKLATTSVYAKLGETSVLVAVTSGGSRPDIDYFPLNVNYEEKLYAGGIIKGSRWVKREGRPSDEAILTSRLIDRSIRPLFPKDYRDDVQIVATLLSVDNVNSPDIVACIAVSAALHVSSIPWEGPVSTIRIGYVPGQEGDEGNSFLINPDIKEQEYSKLDLVATTSKDKVLMIETLAEELSKDTIEEALKLAKQENAKIIDFIESLREEYGDPKQSVSESFIDEKLKQHIKSKHNDMLDQIMKEKGEKESNDSAASDELIQKVSEEIGEEYNKKDIAVVIDYLVKQRIKETTLKNKVRVDGRKPDDIRELSAEVSILSRTHGTGLFNRGLTQVLSVATLGSPSMEQLIESPEGQEVKRYIHHYNFPPYSVGETGRIGFTSRREIGHGALAEKALIPVLPTEKEFPYTIRVVSEVLTSNGSTSMASTCGSSLALMDAGVPIKAPVAGIAMGLMSNSDDDYVILTDIMGVEDFSGEMDFKVTGTKDGITAIQLDVKNRGLTDEMISETLDKATNARMKILEVMATAINQPRATISQYAPKIEIITVPQDKIGAVIGPGGKTIRNIIAETETDVNINDDGVVTITGIKAENVQRAVEMVQGLTKEVEAGEEYEGTVTRILNFGAFVEILPGKEGLIHISKLGTGYVKNVEDVVKEGQEVKVKVLEIDNQGRINLQLLNPPSNNDTQFQEDRR